MADITETVPFNFDELYSGLKTKFEEQGYDTEEGSNTSQLITAMAYLTSMLNVNTAVNINESILPLATRRNNVLQDARALGYEIQHKQSYRYMLTMSLSAGNHTIPKYTEFKIGSKSYYYMGKQIELTDLSEGQNIEVLVVEGTLHKYGDNTQTLINNTTNVKDDFGNIVPQYFIDVPFVDVENNGIEVFVTYYDDFGNLVSKENWVKSAHFMIDAETILNKKYIRLDNIEFSTPRIYFKLAGVGEGVRLGSIVEMNVLVTSGVDGNIENLSDVAQVNNPIPSSSISNIALVSEGTDEESLTSIKSNASKFYNSANRAVTKSDYEAICNRQSTVNTSLVWGGDDEWPKCPGHIWFSFLPSRFERNFTSDEFNYEFNLDNASYTDWDYTLSAIDDEVEYTAQLNDAQSFYSLRFIENSEIRSIEYTREGQLINPGIWDALDNFKIPTLEFHNRNPFFLDFEYDISVLKYNITDSKSEVHQSLFDTINGFFTGVNDVIKMEEFESEYFHSSLEKRIDANLTDVTGYTDIVSTKLLVTLKNVVKENYLPEYRDIFIPLSVPFETYFDNNGFLQYDKLPDIDTENFVTLNGNNGQHLFTDWTEIQTEIDSSSSQHQKPVIYAPIRVKMSESVTLSTTSADVEFNDVKIIPDDPILVDSSDPLQEFTFNNVKIYHNNGVVETELTYGTDWLFDRYDTSSIELTFVPQVNDTIRADVNSYAGTYTLFNSYKKYILVQLFVNAIGFTEYETIQYEFDTPKAYLTTEEGFYDYTKDEFYLTTDGYSVMSEDSINSSTGSIVKKITPSLYINSPIKIDLFRNNRYLNFNYKSANFKVLKNVIPRLKRVTFEQGV